MKRNGSIDRDYRLQVTLPQHFRPVLNYIVRKGDRVIYMSSDETPLALSNLVSGNAAVLRFALEDARDGAEAAKAVRKVLADVWINNKPMMPLVEVLA